jgi:hypothetical protein
MIARHSPVRKFNRQYYHMHMVFTFPAGNILINVVANVKLECRGNTTMSPQC